MIDTLFTDRIYACLKAPSQGDNTSLVPFEEGLRCPETGCDYPLLNGIPALFVEHGNKHLTGRVRAFYEENPFPSYEGVEQFADLVVKGLGSSFSKALLELVGCNKLVLECGCGTGQLSHFLQLQGNHVLGVDMSVSSLSLALEHKRRNNLTRSNFALMNIFDLAVKDSSFDVVISHGVLHHTYDARLAFSRIVQKVKPGGLIIVGLYNRYARIPTWIRSKFIGLLGPNIDYVVRNRIRDKRKAQIWTNDQYFNPHETWHSIGDVLSWFKECNVEYLTCYPGILDAQGRVADKPFARCEQGDAWRQLVTQLSWLRTISREGALFDVVGIRR